MDKTFTVYSTRGGSGKTLLSILLGITSAKKGYKTVVIDVDLEAPSLTHLIRPDGQYYSWVDYIEGRVEDLSKLPVDTFLPNLKIIYSPPPKIGQSFLGWRSKDWWQQALKKTLSAEKKLHELGYNIIIFDNQSGTSLNSINNLAVADASVMVMRPSTYGLGAAGDIVEEIYKNLQDIKPRKDFYVWNQVQQPKNEREEEILGDFIIRWDKALGNFGLVKGGIIHFEPELNFELLSESPNLLPHFETLSDAYTEIFDVLIDQD